MQAWNSRYGGRVQGRVSVLIPLFNRIAYIESTIHSVLSQDHPDVELIVVDDGSTDGGNKLAERYASEGKLTLLYHPGRINRGQSAALNLALGHASGEYIAILDSDDLFMPGKLSAQVAYLREHPEVGLVYGNGQGVDADGRFIYHINYDRRPELSDPNAVLMDCYFLLPQNSLVRHSVYEQVGAFDESLRSGQDHDMLIRIAEVTQLAHIPVDVFRYRRHGDSISAKGTETRWRCGLKILSKAQSRYPYKRGTLIRRRAVVNFRLGQALLKNRRHRVEAIARMLYAGLLDPARAFRVIAGREKVTNA